MKNHGNAPGVGQFAELAAVVQSKLWPAVKGRLSKEEMQALVTGTGPEEVLKRLREVFTAVKSENILVTPPCPFYTRDGAGPESEFEYPKEYAIKSVSEQLVELGQLFPNLNPIPTLVCSKDLADRPQGADGPFVVPFWRKISPNYKEATERVFALFAERYKFNFEDLSQGTLRQSERTIEAESIISEKQGCADYMILWAQLGHRHCRRSVRRAEACYAPNEFGLGAFSVSVMLLTHSARFAGRKDEGIVCPGDEYIPANARFVGSSTPHLFFGIQASEEDVILRAWYHRNFGKIGHATAFLPADVSA